MLPCSSSSSRQLLWIAWMSIHPYGIHQMHASLNTSYKNAQLGKVFFKFFTSFFSLHTGSKSSNMLTTLLKYDIMSQLLRCRKGYRMVQCHLWKPHWSYANNYSSSPGWVISVNAVHSPLGDLSRRMFFSGWCQNVAELGRENWRMNSRWKKAEVARWLFSFFCGSFWWAG